MIVHRRLEIGDWKLQIHHLYSTFGGLRLLIGEEHLLVGGICDRILVIGDWSLFISKRQLPISFRLVIARTLLIGNWRCSLSSAC